MRGHVNEVFGEFSMFYTPLDHHCGTVPYRFAPFSFLLPGVEFMEIPNVLVVYKRLDPRRSRRHVLL